MSSASRRRLFPIKPRSFDTRSRWERIAALKFKCPVPFCGKRFESQDSVDRHVRARARYEQVNAGVVGRSHWDWIERHREA